MDLLVILLVVACGGCFALPVDNGDAYIDQVVSLLDKELETDLEDRAANDFRFLCVGYNLVKGNPDGQTSGSSHGGTDPGIQSTRKICKTDAANSVVIPRDACRTNEDIYENSKSYQEKLQREVNVAGDASYGGFSFSASAGFKSAKEQTTDSHSLIYEKNKLCFTGSERYKVELVGASKFQLTDSFAKSVCDLGTSFSNNEDAYMNLFENWGTHVITELDLGHREIVRKKTSTESLLEYAESTNSAAVSLSGSYGLASGSLSVDFSQFKSDNNFKKTFTSSVSSYTIGSTSLPEPIKLKLAWITDVLDAKYWSNLNDLIAKNICPPGFNVATIKAQLEIAVPLYPKWLKVEKVQAQSISIPLKWPRGTFGLPMPRLSCVQSATGNSNEQSACPSGTWYTGTRYQDTEDSNGPRTLVQPSNQCVTDNWSKTNIHLDHCLKHEAAGDFRLNWPKGRYCIYKVQTCPTGFTSGKIRWDDEDSNNRNSWDGYKMDGQFDTNTIREFCCREDALTTAGIYLPVEKPFILFAKNEHCQKVNGMNVRKDTVFWDDEDSNNRDWRSGSVPYLYGQTKDTKMTFCYYTKA